MRRLLQSVFGLLRFVFVGLLCAGVTAALVPADEWLHAALALGATGCAMYAIVRAVARNWAPVGPEQTQRELAELNARHRTREAARRGRTPLLVLPDTSQEQRLIISIPSQPVRRRLDSIARLRDIGTADSLPLLRARFGHAGVKREAARALRAVEARVEAATQVSADQAGLLTLTERSDGALAIAADEAAHG